MAQIEVNREIRRAVDTGKVVFGKKQSEKSILKGEGQLVIISANAEKTVKEKVRADASVSKIPVFEFSGQGLELGSLCGKPFVVSVMVVEDPGKSAVLKAVESK
jgi:large subunit ribosomal protein L30e